MENNYEAILKETRTNKSASTVTNPMSKTAETQNTQLSCFKNDTSVGVRASNNTNPDTEKRIIFSKPLK